MERTDMLQSAISKMGALAGRSYGVVWPVADYKTLHDLILDVDAGSYAYVVQMITTCLEGRASHFPPILVHPDGDKAINGTHRTLANQVLREIGAPDDMMIGVVHLASTDIYCECEKEMLLDWYDREQYNRLQRYLDDGDSDDECDHDEDCPCW